MRKVTLINLTTAIAGVLLVVVSQFAQQYFSAQQISVRAVLAFEMQFVIVGLVSGLAVLVGSLYWLKNNVY